MKFNKSCILLIAIAIFLLISIGSVCASENITDNSDAPLADDGTNVVLSNDSDTDNNVPDDTNTEKINTTIETENSYEFKEDSNKTFTVHVKDNKTKSNIDVNKNDFIISNGDKNISFEYNSSIITITEKLSVGKYNLTVNYLGNGTYYNSSKIIAVKIYGNKTIETETSVVYDGEHIAIPVKVTDQVDYIELNKDNFNLTLVYTNETGNVTNLTINEFSIENDTIKFNTTVNFIKAHVTIAYTNVTESKNVDIKVSTEVKAKEDEYKFKSEENKTISITVSGVKGNQLNINKTDLKVFDNGNEITNFGYNNSNITLNLDVGVHNVTIRYVGNETYASNETIILVKVSGNQTISPQESANIDSNNKVNINLNLSDGADPVNVDLTKLNVTLYWTVGNQTYNKTVEGITLADDNQTIIFEVTENFESAYADIKYAAENNLTGKTTLKMATEIISPDTKQTGVGEVVNFTVEVKSANGTSINVTADNIKILSNGKEVKFTVNNSVITLTENLTYGIYDLTINYLGTDTYANYTKIMALTVYGINATSSINVNSTKKGEVNITIINGNNTVNITADDLILNITYKNGNDTIVINITNCKIENGTLYFTLENGNFTTATLNIKYNNTECNVTLNRIYNAKIEINNLENEYMTGNYTFKLIDIDTNEPLANKTVNFETDNYFTDVVGGITSSNPARGSATSDSEGILNFVNSKIFATNYGMNGTTISLIFHYMDVGTYNVTLKPNDNLKFDSFKTNVTITKANLIITPIKFSEYYGTDKKYSITVTSATTGEVLPNILLKLLLPQLSTTTYYLTTNSEGVAELSGMNNLVGGDYKVVISNNDTKNINNVSKEDTITIKKIPVVISGKDVTIQYNTGKTYTITVKQNGKAVSGMYLEVRLYTTSSKYDRYVLQTNSKGQFSFSASLDVGKHKIVISSADNRYSASKVTKTITVKKANGKLTAKKTTTAYYNSGSTFVVKLTNSKNKKPIYAAKIKIQIKTSKVKYNPITTHTDMNGKARLNLNGLAPGKYKVVITGVDSKNFNAKKITKTIVVKKAPAKITPKKLTAKKGAKKYFKVTVKNKKTKKVVSGVKVKVKVYTGKKAKTFTAKTNSKGIAKILTNKLKVGKHKVVITSANKYVVAKKAKSTIKIKK